MSDRPITTIDTGRSVITLINVYEVEPEKQTELARVLAEATEHVMRHLPGFVSVNIHCSLDGMRVVNYAQWASREDFESMMKRPEVQAQLKRFGALAKSVSPAIYRVTSVHIK